MGQKLASSGGQPVAHWPAIVVAALDAIEKLFEHRDELREEVSRG